MSKTDFFWTDVQQALERIGRSVVLYDNQPYYVETVEDHADGTPRARVRPCGDPEAKGDRKMLNSPKFQRFRELPNLGWMNNVGNKHGAMFLARRTMTTRVHGLNSNNIHCHAFIHNPNADLPILRPGDHTFANVMFNEGFVDCHNDKFPALTKILAIIKENTSIAFSRKFCVLRDATGLRWMYRNTDRVGIFTGVDTLNLISKYGYLREEIMSDPAFTLDNLREF